MKKMKLSKAPKIPRNSLCFCGSGKKYKKCCLLKKQKQEEQRLESIRMVEKLKEKDAEKI